MKAWNSDSNDSFMVDDVLKSDEERCPGDGNDSGNETGNFPFEMTTEQTLGSTYLFAFIWIIKILKDMEQMDIYFKADR